MFRTVRTLAFALLAGPAIAQTAFVDVTPVADPAFTTPEDQDFWISAVAPADVDGDGDLDLAVLGFHVVYDQSVEDRLLLLLNQGPGSGGEWQFATVPVALGKLVAGASDLAWGDYDNDGDHDLVVGSEGATVLYRNDGGSLSALPDLLPGYYEDSAYTGSYDLRSLGFADYDNDGDQDLLVPSVFDFETFEFHTRLLRNEGGGGGWQLVDSGLALPDSAHAQSAWADDDDDGDLDLLLVNIEPNSERGYLSRLGNDGNAFTASAPLAGLRVHHGLADWGDADGDGDLDLLVVGNIEEPDGSFVTVLRLYRNQGVGAGYQAETLASGWSASWLDLYAATWADYDSDGDVDILLTGNQVVDGAIVGRSAIFANSGGSFMQLGTQLDAPAATVGRGGAFTWFDIDGDGDLDYLVAGAYYQADGNGLVEARMHLYRNGATLPNQAPTAPGALQASAMAGGGIELAWSSAADDHTPPTALTYELQLLRAGQPIGQARPLPQPGNLGARQSWRLQGLEAGLYEWRIQAVDSAYHAGPAASAGFQVGVEAPLFGNGFE